MPTRRERMLIQQQRAQQAQRQRRYLLIGAALAAVVIVLAGGFAVSNLFAQPAATPVAQAVSPAGMCSAIQSFPTLSRDHISPGESHPPYSSNPPTSGWHWDNPQDWGIYTTPQVQEQLVHNLEHGGIIVQYNGLSSAEVQTLTQIVQSDSHHIILAPYPGLPSDVRVALTAWDHLQTCTGVDANAVRAFTNAFRDKGPELVP